MNHDDPVPLLPWETPGAALGGLFRHLGQELRLTDRGDVAALRGAPAEHYLLTSFEVGSSSRGCATASSPSSGPSTTTRPSWPPWPGAAATGGSSAASRGSPGAGTWREPYLAARTFKPPPSSLLQTQYQSLSAYRLAAGPDCSLVLVDVTSFNDLVRKVPGLGLEVTTVMARRLRRANPTG